MAAPNLLSNTRFNYFWKNLGKRTRWPCQGWEIYFCQHLPDHPGCPKSPSRSPTLAWHTLHKAPASMWQEFSHTWKDLASYRSCPRQQPSLTAHIYYVGLVWAPWFVLIYCYTSVFNDSMCFFITRALCTFSWICRILMHIYNLRFLTGPTLWYTTFPWKNCVLSPTRSL